MCIMCFCVMFCGNVNNCTALLMVPVVKHPITMIDTTKLKEKKNNHLFSKYTNNMKSYREKQIKMALRIENSPLYTQYKYIIYFKPFGKPILKAQLWLTTFELKIYFESQ